MCKNNGVLFENDLIQIGVKSEFRQNLGRLGLFYGNKTSFPLQSFVPNLLWSDDQAAKMSIQMKPVEPTLEAGAQIQQLINAECIDDYTGKYVALCCIKLNTYLILLDTPSMNISFICNNIPQKITIKLPLTINKFFEPTEMNGESFFARWKNLGRYVIVFVLNI